jgi:hypothetical protein
MMPPDAGSSRQQLRCLPDLIISQRDLDQIDHQTRHLADSEARLLKLSARDHLT